MKTVKLRKNYQIRWPEVMVIDETGKRLGLVKTQEAITMAQEKGFDLVEILPNPPKGQPAIARIMDYGKYMYEKAKKEKGKPKSAGELEEKIIRMGLKTDKHDLEIKAKKIDEFLAKGHKVVAEIFLRGRENRMSDLAKEKLELFLKYITTPHINEGMRKVPRGWNVILRKAK